MLFFREAVGLSEEELKVMRAAPAWAGRLAAAHTIPREFADADYELKPHRFESLTTPTLLLAGGESPPFLRKATEMAHAAIPNSQVAVMEGEHHIAMNTAPELFTKLVIEFLA